MPSTKKHIHSPELESYCERSIDAKCPRCGETLVHAEPKSMHVSCYDCFMAGHVDRLRAYPIKKLREDNRREALLDLPEAEVDRFMLKIVVGYPDESSEETILDKTQDGFDAARPATYGLATILDVPTLTALRKAVRDVHVELPVRRYVTAIVRATL